MPAAANAASIRPTRVSAPLVVRFGVVDRHREGLRDRHGNRPIEERHVESLGDHAADDRAAGAVGAEIVTTGAVTGSLICT